MKLRLQIVCVMGLPLFGAQRKEPTMKVQVCVETIAAYGQHVRFTTAEHLQILLNDRAAINAQGWPYRNWESASETINWFDGTKPVTLAYVKSHMPRAMLLRMRFPVDQHPHVVQTDLDRLLKAEQEYERATKSGEVGLGYLRELMKKYVIGPNATLDQDMGGATPMFGCAKYEQDSPSKP